MYQEPVKNFNKIREYIREFYINGFKSRQDYTIKSARSYDNEKRRIESYMSDYIDYHMTPSGKIPYLSIDTRVIQHNPLYRVLKTKSFTDYDIILHFLILDLLHTSLSVSELMDQIDDKTNYTYLYDESTLRKKLKEYVKEGLLITTKKGKKIYYQLSEDYIIPHDILDFFSEVSPCGVIGSYILDKQEKEDSLFGFKHHYLTHVLDSEVLYDLFNAIHQHKYVSIRTSNNRIKVIPLSIFISVQDGRQYLMAYMCRNKKMHSFRLDHIISIKSLEEAEDFKVYRKELEEMKKHLWGVSFSNGSLETVEFTLYHEPWEEHIYRRLLREKRCGYVERVNENTSRFYAEVYDVKEMIPWIRTFICRIQSISISNKEVEKQFKQDLEEMYRYYEEDEDDIS